MLMLVIFLVRLGIGLCLLIGLLYLAGTLIQLLSSIIVNIVAFICNCIKKDSF